ncbi:MAG: glycosyltransferase [Microthrixaceae bacterium]
MHEIEIQSRSLRRMAGVIGEDLTSELAGPTAGAAKDALGGRAVLNVNSTGAGGGVAEMLRVVLGYARDAGVDARWLVIEGDEPFFALTKRIHNHLYGTPGDGGPLGAAEHQLYQECLERSAVQLLTFVRPGDVVILHDPQVAGLAQAVKAAGGRVAWRCHVGLDEQNEHSEKAWEFLRGYLEPHVEQFVFSREEFAPSWVPRERLVVVPPSIDPFSPKNQPLDPETIQGIMSHTGFTSGPDGHTYFERTDGTPGRLERSVDLIATGPRPDPDEPLITQISRWDTLKDMAGVLEAFVEGVAPSHPGHLVLAGPSVASVDDDPEGADVLADVWARWRSLPYSMRRRVTLACLPMDDLDENAVMVNALQRRSAIVVQKSLAEGFGLTVAEAMIKSRPVVASNVGGIADQITHGVTGLLVQDPTDLGTFAEHLRTILGDQDLASRLGEAAYQRAVDEFLVDTHLTHWLEVVRRLVA